MHRPGGATLLVPFDMRGHASTPRGANDTRMTVNSDVATRQLPFLGIYLNDHLGSSTSGLQLVRRTARAHADTRARRFFGEFGLACWAGHDDRPTFTSPTTGPGPLWMRLADLFCSVTHEADHRIITIYSHVRGASGSIG